jgi:hypothetical protein
MCGTRYARPGKRGYQGSVPEACSPARTRASEASGKQMRTHGQSALDIFNGRPGGKECRHSQFSTTFTTFARSEPAFGCRTIIPMSHLPISERVEWRTGRKGFAPQREMMAQIAKH